MATRTTEIEKELMWKLYQKYGVIKTVAEKVGQYKFCFTLRKRV